MSGTGNLHVNRLWWLVAALWFAAWHLFYTVDCWLDPLWRIPGPIGDNTVMLWNLGWVRHALRHGETGFWFTNAYYPDGFLFLYGTHTWLDGVLFWMTSLLWPDGAAGAILWANVSLMMATVLTGVLAVAILRTWGLRSFAVLLMASSAVAFCWFRQFALTGHYHFFATQYMLAALWLLSKWRRDVLLGDFSRGLRWAVAAGGVMGLAFLNDQTMTVFAAVLGGLVIGSVMLNSQTRRSALMATAAYYGSSIVVASVHLLPMAWAIADGRFEYTVTADSPRLVDASSLVVPPALHCAGETLQGLRERFGLTWSEGTYLGVVAIVMIGFMAVAALRFLGNRKVDSPLRISFCCLVLAVVFLVCALGDRLIIGRWDVMLMPGRLLREIPIVDNIRLPQRWVWPAHLCIALGGAVAAQALLDQSRRRGAWVGLFVGLAVIAGVEGKKDPAIKPTDYRSDPFVNKGGLVESVREFYNGGGVLVMPVVSEVYAYANILQLQWGYDIPVTLSYTARMPFQLRDVPWFMEEWNPEAEAWLRDKDVRMLVFPHHEFQAARFDAWIRHAKETVPGLVVLDEAGREI